MENCKAAKFNPANACTDACKWPGVCPSGAQARMSKAPEPVADEECMATVMEMAAEESIPDATEGPPETPEEAAGTEAPATKPKRSRKSSK